MQFYSRSLKLFQLKYSPITMFGEYSTFWCQPLYLGISISNSSLSKAHKVQIYGAHNVLKHYGTIFQQACSISNSERVGDRVFSYARMYSNIFGMSMHLSEKCYKFIRIDFLIHIYVFLLFRVSMGQQLLVRHLKDFPKKSPKHIAFFWVLLYTTLICVHVHARVLV